MVSDQQLQANFGFMAIPALGVLSAPFLQVKTKHGVDLGTPYATLEEACLVSALGVLLLSPVSNRFCQRQRPKSGNFVCLTVFHYHSVGAT
jgi:hypothetical protein